MRIDLNCDLGEGGAYDRQVMRYITSANIACGSHAGDDSTIRAALAAAAEHGVQIGAHPGYPDREHFGRREQPLDAAAIQCECNRQVEFLQSLAGNFALPLRYLKPHGALYNQACRDINFAQPIVAVARRFELAVMGLPRSKLAEASAGLRFITEGFADRRYRADGSLVPRDQPDAFIDEPRDAVEQVEWLIGKRGVESICVHGDNPAALDFVRILRQDLTQRGYAIQPFDARIDGPPHH